MADGATWLFVSTVFKPRDAPFAGGDHALLSMARTLAARSSGAGSSSGSGTAGSSSKPAPAAGAHLMLLSTRAEVLAAAARGGFLGRLAPSGTRPGVASWRDDAGVAHHAVLSDEAGGEAEAEGGGASSDPGPALRRLLDAGDAILAEAAAAVTGRAGPGEKPGQEGGGHGRRFWVAVDADGAQRRAPGAETSLLEAATARWGRRVLVLVQNVHSLPFGLEGAAPRAPGLLAAWRRVGGAVAPSRFVADYLAAAAPEVERRCGGSGGSGGGGADGASPLRRCVVVPYAAWGAFGAPPFADLGACCAARLRRREDAAEGAGADAAAEAGGERMQLVQQQEQQQRQDQHEQQQQRWAPVVAMLKLTPEKGAALFSQLARRLPALRFVAVAGDHRAAAAEAARLGLANVAVLPPARDVGALLAETEAAAVVVPSVWAEAYGMVAVDAALRGLPVLVSARGGLPEAGLGAAVVLPVEPMRWRPASAETGGGGRGGEAAAAPAGAVEDDDQAEPEEGSEAAAAAAAAPVWARREIPPEQPPAVVEAWADELTALLLAPGAAARYAARAAAAREAAAALLAGRARHLADFEAWLRALEAEEQQQQGASS